MTPYYQDGQSTIYHGDLREFRRGEISDVNCTVFSPPYNVDLAYGTHDDLMGWKAYRE